ncbi:MAG: O-antigen ligase family protein [Anaerolineae bacterium]|jgi:O-antigen ligase
MMEQKAPSGDQRRSGALFLLSLVGLLVISILAGVALVANRQARTRGIPPGLPPRVAHADVSPFCINAPLGQYDGEALGHALDLIAGAGFDRVRQTFPWATIEPQPGTYDWTVWDRIVEETTSRGLDLVAVLDVAPAHAGAPPSPDDFASFAQALAARYGERIDAYQIWHNPNLADGWGGYTDPAAYAQLLQQAAEVIRAVDPEARILLGSLAPTAEQGPENLSEVRFLRRLYAAGAGPYFDVVTAQPYGFDTGPTDRRVDEATLNFSRAILLRQEMVAHGDGDKAVWASHFGWNSLPAGWDEVRSIWGSVDEDTQAVYTAAALERARREWPWMGAMCLAHFQPDTGAPDLASGTPNAERHWGFAAVGPDGEPRPVLHAVSQLSHAPPTNMPGAYAPLSGVADWVGDWAFSELGADVSEDGGDQVTIPFWGTDLGLTLRRGDYRGTFYITVDGKPAGELPRDDAGRAYLILTSPDYTPQVTTVPIASDLAPGDHSVIITAERGWDQWALVGWRVAYHPADAAFRWSLAGLAVLALACVAGMVSTGRHLRFGALGTAVSAAWGRLSDGVQLALTALTTGLLWLAAWMTWGVEAGDVFRRLGDEVGITATLAAAGLFYYSPWFLLTLVAGALLFVLILLRLELGLALIAALAPFFAFPWTMFNRAFSMAEIVTLMALASWGVRQLCRLREHGRIRWPRWSARAAWRSADLAVGFLVIVALISPFFAEFQRVAWRELRVVILEPAAFYLMLRTADLKRKDLWRVVDFFVLGGVAVAVIGLVQYALGINLITAEAGISRLRSVYGSPNNVGLYLGRVLPLLVAFALFGRHRWRRLTYSVAALPVAAALLLSFSKGALLLGVPASLLTMGLLAGGPWLWITLGGVAVAALAAIPLLRHPRFASLLDTQGGTTFFRLKLWQATVAMIRDHPWLGVGLDNFLYQYRGRYILPDAWQEPDLSHPHNILLDHWARLGVLGVAAGTWLQVAFWRLALPLRRLRDPDQRALALGLMGAMADTLAHGLVDHSFFLIDLAFAFLLIVALAHALRGGRMGPPPEETIEA